MLNHTENSIPFINLDIHTYLKSRSFILCPFDFYFLHNPVLLHSITPLVAIEYDCLDLIDYLIQSEHITLQTTVDLAVAYGSQSLVRHLLMNHHSNFVETTSVMACYGGRLSIVELLFEFKIPFPNFISDFCVLHGHRDIVLLLHKNGFSPTQISLHWVFQKIDSTMIALLLSLGIKMTPSIYQDLMKTADFSFIYELGKFFSKHKDKYFDKEPHDDTLLIHSTNYQHIVEMHKYISQTLNVSN